MKIYGGRTKKYSASDFEVTDSNSWDEEQSNKLDFGSDDEAADPNFFPHDSLSDDDDDDNMETNLVSEAPKKKTPTPTTEDMIDSSYIADRSEINVAKQAPRKISKPTIYSEMKEYDEQNGWNYGTQAFDKQIFIGEGSAVQIENITQNADLFTIFRLLVYTLNKF